MHYYFKLKRPAMSYAFSMCQYYSTSYLQPALNKQSGWFRNFRFTGKEITFSRVPFFATHI
jgi:hypothetical protein